LDTNGREVVRVLATDKDTGANGDVTYELLSGDDGAFVIDAHMGALRLDNAAALTRSQYVLTIRASDGGRPKFADTCTVRVHVVDSAESGTFKFDRYTLTDLTHTSHSCTVM
jgi:hypothetical protein